MGIHLLISGFLYLIGNLAIPRDLEEFYGNYGTTATCTLQGFLHFITTRTSAAYYGGLSIYSYVAVLTDFDRKKYEWCEKWIHLAVNIYVIATAFYLLAIQGYNPKYGYCSYGSYPMGCELSDDVVCERGPASFGLAKLIFILVVPLIIFMVVPTTLMIVLYCKVKKREGNEDPGKSVLITSRQVAIQSCAYLSAVYWTVLPLIVILVLQYSMGANSESLVPYVMASQINYCMVGVWFMLVYWYFTIDHLDDETVEEPLEDDPTKTNRSKRKTRTTHFIFNTGSSRILEKSLSKLFENSETSDSTTRKTSGQTTTPDPDPPAKRYSFNIFDGTNASGAYADFIHDGDSEDERMDQEETDRWNACQEHI